MTSLFDKPFSAYDKEHPEIWRHFEDFTFGLIKRGVKHYGAKAICEVIRFHRTIDHGVDEYKVNNNYTAGYARKWKRLHPEHADFFETRKRK